MVVRRLNKISEAKMLKTVIPGHGIGLIKYLDHPVLDAIGWIFVVLRARPRITSLILGLR